MMDEESKGSYEKTGYKFTAVLSKKIEVGRAMNALAHMTAGMVGKAQDIGNMGIVNYEDKDNSPHYASKHPFIILKAKNSNHIKAARDQAIELGLDFSSFTSAMIAGSYEEQLTASKSQGAGELEYFGLCMFGKTEDIDSITKKFSLFL